MTEEPAQIRRTDNSHLLKSRNNREKLPKLLNETQLKALKVVADQTNGRNLVKLPTSEIALALGLSRQTAHKAMKRLSDLDFIEIHAHPRGSMVKLNTEKLQ